MASEILDPRFINIPRRTFYLSLLLHVSVLFVVFSSNVLDLSSIELFKKKPMDKVYQDFVQVDMVALPEKVGMEDKFVDPSLPIVKNPVEQMVKQAEQTQEDDAMEL